MANKKEEGSAEPRAGYVWDADKLAWVRPTEPKGEEGTAGLSQPSVETRGESSPAEAAVEVKGEEGVVEAAIEAEGLVYRGALVRLLAFVIDFIALMIIAVILTAIFGTETAAVETEVAEASIVSWVILALFLVYFVGFWTWRGQTPGKMVIRAKIVKTNGSPIGLGRAFLRYIGYSVYFLVFSLSNYIIWVVPVFILLIAFSIIAFSREKRGLHDMVAGTCVIDSRAIVLEPYTDELAQPSDDEGA